MQFRQSDIAGAGCRHGDTHRAFRNRHHALPRRAHFKDGVTGGVALDMGESGQILSALLVQGFKNKALSKELFFVQTLVGGHGLSFLHDKRNNRTLVTTVAMSYQGDI